MFDKPTGEALTGSVTYIGTGKLHSLWMLLAMSFNAVDIALGVLILV